MSLGQDRLTFAAVMIAAAVAVFGYIKLGNVFDVSDADVAGQNGVAGENEEGRERVQEEVPGGNAEESDGAGHRDFQDEDLQDEQDQHDPAGG